MRRACGLHPTELGSQLGTGGQRHPQDESNTLLIGRTFALGMLIGRSWHRDRSEPLGSDRQLHLGHEALKGGGRRIQTHHASSGWQVRRSTLIELTTGESLGIPSHQGLHRGMRSLCRDHHGATGTY